MKALNDASYRLEEALKRAREQASPYNRRVESLERAKTVITGIQDMDWLSEEIKTAMTETIVDGVLETLRKK